LRPVSARFGWAVHNLDVDGTIYGIAIEISGNVVTVVAPNGRRTSVTDTDLGGMTFRYGIWQIVAGTNDFKSHWNGVILGEPLDEITRALGYSAGYAMAKKGTNTNDAATAGDIGEYVESKVDIGSPVSAGATDAWGDVTSISLTACVDRDWETFPSHDHGG